MSNKDKDTTKTEFDTDREVIEAATVKFDDGDDCVVCNCTMHLHEEMESGSLCVCWPCAYELLEKAMRRWPAALDEIERLHQKLSKSSSKRERDQSFELGCLYDALDVVREEKAVLEQERAKLRAELKSKDQYIDDIESKCERYQRERNDDRIDYAKTYQERDQLRVDFDKSVAALELLTGDLDRMEDERDQLRAEAEHLKKENAEIFSDWEEDGANSVRLCREKDLLIEAWKTAAEALDFADFMMDKDKYKKAFELLAAARALEEK